MNGPDTTPTPGSPETPSASAIQTRLKEREQRLQAEREQAARKKPRRGRKWLLPALIVASLGITGFALMRPKGPGATPVNVVRAATGTLVKTVNGTGSAKAEVSRSLSFASAGNVSRVNVRVGDPVQAGDVLAELNTDAAQRDLAAARAALTGAQADLSRAEATARETQRDQARQLQAAQNTLASAQAALNAAQRSLDNQQALLRVGGVSAQAVQTARDSRDDAQRKVQAAQEDLNFARSKGSESSRAAVTQAQAALESARVRVQNLEQNVADAQLRAPTAGVVSVVNVTAGNPPTPGQSAVEITDPNRVYLEVPFDETRAAGITPGQPASVQFDALPTQTFSGTVSRVEPTARASGQVSSVLVRIRLPDVRDVKPGFTASATVTTRRLKDAVTVPLETTTEVGGKTKVWKVTPKANASAGAVLVGIAAPVTVTVQERNASRAAVTGIAAGDLIVTPSPGDLKEGQDVSYAAPGKAPAGQP